jgi:hypothetical protein
LHNRIRNESRENFLSSDSSLINNNPPLENSSWGINFDSVYGEEKNTFNALNFINKNMETFLIKPDTVYNRYNHGNKIEHHHTTFNESPEILSKKFHIVKEHGMIPVFCIGETLENYQQKKTKEVLRFQLESLLKTADFLFEKCIIAYEPVWAIGTGLTPTHDEIKHVFSDIKEIIKDMSPKTTDIHMLYGGSVNEKNISMINSIETCSGVLVGGASLKVKQLLEIIKCITYC